MNASNSSTGSSIALRTGTASVFALLGTSSLQGAIITNTNLGLNGFTVGNGSGSMDWNIDNADGAEVNVSSVGSLFIDLRSFENAFAVRSISASGLTNIGPDAYVNGNPPVSFEVNGLNSVLASGSIKDAAGFISGDSGYIGFRFNPTGTVLYGWAEVVLTNGGSTGTFEVAQWAYDNTGADIKTGVVPEPETAALGLGALAFGAAGLRQWRKRKVAKAA